ncbi:taste receptor type 2 member 39-like [Dendropsophus ebraccatus]|uniref:taste receptor type 2 member 39-like n=1 Tax=Dendropsophus ebraccatus TaxID=150705 RepID=UPI003831A46E
MDPGSPGSVLGLSVLVAEVFVGVFTIIFITSVILYDSYRKKMIDNKAKIRLALKVSSLFFMTVLPYFDIYNVLQPDHSTMPHESPVFTVVIVYCMCSCSWLITLQCFFYFIKIVHFRWVFIRWAKLRISAIVTRQIVVVEVVSLSASLLHLLPYRMTQDSSTNSSYISSTYNTLEEMIVNNYGSYLVLIIVFSLLLLTTTATFVTTAFLRCHIMKMKDTKTTGEVHQYNLVVQKMLRFLFLFSFFNVMMFLYYFSVFKHFTIGYWINLVLVFSFIPTINILQIFETPLLRAAWKEMISYVTRSRGSQ